MNDLLEFLKWVEQDPLLKWGYRVLIVLMGIPFFGIIYYLVWLVW